MKNFRYSAKFTILAKLIYECHDLGSGGGGGGGLPIFPMSNMRSAPLPSGQECFCNTVPITSINMQKPFLLPQVININNDNKIVSVTDLKQKGKRIFNALSLVQNLDLYQSPNNAASNGAFGTVSFTKFSDNMLLMSDLTDLELAPGVYDFERYSYPVAGDNFPENRRVTQYLFYYEKI